MNPSQTHWQNRNKDRTPKPTKAKLQPIVSPLADGTSSYASEVETDLDEPEINEEVPEERILGAWKIVVEPVYDDEGFLVIDGADGEGGGQVFRMGLALSGILQKKVKFINIRSNRSNSGLGQQHVSILQTIQQIYSAKVSEFGIGCSELTFEPSPFTFTKRILCQSTSASSISLMIQAVLPCLIFGSSKMIIEFHGGTHVSKAPHLEYITNVIQPICARFGATFSLLIKRKGYMASGGGIVELSVTPVHHLKSISVLTRGNISKISFLGFHSGTVPVEVPQRMVQDAIKRIDPIISSQEFENRFQKEKIHCEIVREAKALGSASGLNILIETDTGGMFCSSSIGGKGVNAEKVSKTSMNCVLRNLRKGGSVDEFLQDQLLIFCLLAKGESSFRCGPLTQHTMTLIHLFRFMTRADILITKTKLEERVFEQEKSYIISCNGINFTNPHQS